MDSKEDGSRSKVGENKESPDAVRSLGDKSLFSGDIMVIDRERFSFEKQQWQPEEEEDSERCGETCVFVSFSFSYSR